ncbi:MAG: Mpo1-like protein [Alteraurantiacibacter sp.]
MTPLARTLAKYGAYHRDRRNVATHLVGIPMIVLAVVVLLSRPMWSFGDFALTPAIIGSLLASYFYLRLDLRFGIAMALLLVVLQSIGSVIAFLPTPLWLGCGLGLFVAGWVIQFVGHYFEGRKPAFVDDLKSLLVGPLFVVAELAFMLGLRRDLQAQISGQAPH